MTASKWMCAALLGSALFSLAPTASAEPTPQDKERARDLMADGRDKRDRNDFPGALESFKQADAIMHVPTTGYEVAKTQQAIGKLLEARETAAGIAKLPVSPSDPPPFTEARTKAEGLVKEIDAKLGHLKVTTSTATVKIDDTPATLDAAQTAHVLPGKHVVSDGSVRVDVTVAAGETKDVSLDGDTKSVITATPVTAPSTFPIPTLSLVGFGIGAAGLAVGTVTGIMAIGDESDIADRCQGNRCTRAVEDDLDSAKTKATISTIGFIVAGVGIAVGVVGFFIQPKAETKVGSATIDFTRLRATF